jgi:hypothetical protein
MANEKLANIRKTLRLVIGWILITLFASMVAIWVAFGFVPALITASPEPLAALGRVGEFWPILVASVSGAGAAWALSPRVRVGVETEGGGSPGPSPMAVVIFGPSALVMIFAAYWPCSGDTSQFWTALRNTLEAFQGNAADPFGTVVGCPAVFPPGLLAGVLFGKATLVLMLGIGLAYLFRHTLDGIRARSAPRVIILSGVSDETTDAVRWVASPLNITRRVRLVLVDAGPELARARELARDLGKTAKVTVIALDIADDKAVETFMRHRARRGIHGLYLLSPDSAANLRAADSFLNGHERFSARARNTEIPGRVVVRVDNPWHAEDWRRKQMISRPDWLFDAVSVLEIAARHVVNKLKDHDPPIDRVVISGGNQFDLAVLSGLSFEHSMDDFLHRTSMTEQVRWEQQPNQTQPYHAFQKRTPFVVLVGPGGQRVAEHFRDQLRRYGIPNAEEIMDVCAEDDSEQVMTRLIEEGHVPALIVDGASRSRPGSESTFLAVRHPAWIIFDWDPQSRGITDEPLLGGLSVAGPTTKPVPGFGLDIWDRLGAIQHRTYLLKFCGGLEESNDVNQKRGLWEDLSAFARESNIRSFANFTRTVGSLPRRRRLGTDLGPTGSQVPAPLQDPSEFEVLAIREHQSWVAHHREYGYRFGATRKGKQHPDMVDWSELGVDERRKDIENVRTTDELLSTLGFTLTDAP